ncbi:hypothetical protein AAE026_09235 [Bradyrhizobium sp. DN5]|uniref:hypothetical protein n=1 Tax=Bradyrhizobium sp. DN5 TaxID=3056950 RepID=UPI003523CCAC
MRGIYEIYVRHIDVSWVQCYKTIDPHEILDRFATGSVEAGTAERAGQATTGDQIYRAIVERHFGKTYWTSAFGKSMSSATCWPRETGRNKAGGGPDRHLMKPAGPEQGQAVPEQRRYRQREPRT